VQNHDGSGYAARVAVAPASHASFGTTEPASPTPASR